MAALLQYSSDAHHLDLVQTTRVKGTVPNRTAHTADGSHEFGGSEGPSALLTNVPINVGGSHGPLSFDNSLEQLTEHSKVYLVITILL